MKTITQVASELGVKHWHIRHAYDANHLDKPPVFAGRFVYGDDHIAELKHYFNSRKEHDDTTLENILDR